MNKMMLYEAYLVIVSKKMLGFFLPVDIALVGFFDL